MTGGFLVQYLLALLVVALMLFGLYTVVRALGRGRLISASDKRLVSIVESTFVSQNTTLHVVKVADKYYLIGGGAGHLTTLGELPPESVEPWLAQQRELFANQTKSLAALLAPFRRRKP